MTANNKYSTWKMPTCAKCGRQHPNFLKVCPPKPPESEYVRRQPPPEGFHESKGWGVGTSQVPVIYSLPARRRTGSLTMNGEPYKPTEPAA